MEYDDANVKISFWKDSGARAAYLAKNGNSEAAELWGDMVDDMQALTTTGQSILESNELSGFSVTVECLDEQDKTTVLASAMDGRVTYDASK